jgi:hypothetical protein
MSAMSELNEMDCAAFASVAAELALGVLTGRERAEALAHLDRCETCRAEVRELTLTGEELLGLMPAIEPPPGFETRVMARIGAGEARGSRVSRTRRMLALAAVALAAAGAGVGGWGLHAALAPAPPASSGAGTALSSAALVSASGQQAGRIFLYHGSPGWLYMSVEMPSANGTVVCQVVGSDGRVSTVGSFRLTDGYGAWGSPVPANAGQLAGARLVSADGTVLATARFNTQ